MTMQPSPSPAPRAAATVVMLRDTANGLEVFMLKRHGLSDVLGGAYVFPGGKVDQADSVLHPQAQLDQPATTLCTHLGELACSPQEAVALYVAAAREAFEESGVLFAQGTDPTHPVDAAQATALCHQGQSFGHMLTHMALRLCTHRLVPWSRWITPEKSLVMNKRFDTRFFVAAMPEGQNARHDDHETTASAWLTPRLALEQYHSGHIELAPPQIMSLVHLAHHATVHEVLQAARAQKPPLIQPEVLKDEGAPILCYPGDERHPVPNRALPGPTRLEYRNQRFEPPGGFDALWGTPTISGIEPILT